MVALRRFGFLLRPRWILFHLLVALAVAVMVSLGLWQLRRLDERQSFNATARAHLAAPVAPLAQVLSPGVDEDTVEWRSVDVTGTFLPGKQVLVVNRSQGNRAGRNVVDPLLLDDGTVLIVNRGFVASLEPVPALPTGEVRLVGRLRASEERRTGQGQDARGVVLTEVRRVDIETLAPQMGGDVLPMYVDMVASVPAQPGLEPVPLPDTSGEGPHLSYAVQWFTFSALALAGWVLAVRRSLAARSGRRRKRRGPPPIADELARA